MGHSHAPNGDWLLMEYCGVEGLQGWTQSMAASKRTKTNLDDEREATDFEELSKSTLDMLFALSQRVCLATCVCLGFRNYKLFAR